MKILILTEHGGHSRHNSVYKIAVAIWQHPAVQQVCVASRSDAFNSDFFAGLPAASLRGISVDQSFSFPADEMFLKNSDQIDLDDIHAIFLRIPHPINLHFFETINTRFSHIPIVNDPRGILKTGNKAFLLTLDQAYTVPMAICHTWQSVLDFNKKYDCVLKPLQSYGGKGIIRILDGKIHDSNGYMSWESLAARVARSDQPFLAMQYLHYISRGDKRLVVVNGEILSSSLRMPAIGGWLANVAQGGHSFPAEVDDRDVELVDYLSPILKAEGIFYYGLDSITNDKGIRIISEINTLSIGGITPVEESTQLPLSSSFATLFIQYVLQFSQNDSSPV